MHSFSFQNIAKRPVNSNQEFTGLLAIWPESEPSPAPLDFLNQFTLFP